MCSKPPTRPEYAIADLESGDVLADRVNRPGKLHPENVDLLRASKAVHEPSDEDGAWSSQPPVAAANRRRNDSHQDVVVGWNRLFDILNSGDSGGPIASVDGGPH